MNISYLLEMRKPHTHFFHVTMTLEDANEDSVVATMPVWTPGAYEIADFPRHIRNLKAISDHEKKLTIQRKDKSSWKVLNGNAKNFRLEYEVYADELSVHTSHLDSSHGYINGASLFLYLDGYKDQAVEVNIRPPQGWKISTGLEKTGDNKYRAINYDILVDSPIEIGKHRSLFFTVADREHEIVLYGSGNEDEEKLRSDIKSLVEAYHKIMGALPYKRYVFIYHLIDQLDSYGGLEHLNSTSIDVNSFGFAPKSEYNRFLSVTSHEFFHLWNVKRIKPAELIPFNYKEEMYTPSLWLSEGVTNFYTWIAMLRAGLVTEEEYFKHIMEMIRFYELLPGPLVESAADSSFDSWIKLYRPSPNNINSYVSYYLKGELLGVMLNARIVEATKANRNLDDFFKILLDRYNKDGKGFAEKDLLSALKEVSGVDFMDFFDKFVRGTVKIDFDREFERIGYGIKRGYNKIDEVEPDKKAYLGILMKSGNSRYRIDGVIEGSPAYEHGINVGDELVAVNGAKFGDRHLKDLLDESKRMKTDNLRDFLPGDRVSLHFFRRNTLTQLDVVLGNAPYEYYKAEKKENEDQETYAQKYLYG